VWLDHARRWDASGGYRTSLLQSEISTLPNHSFQLYQYENMAKVSSRTVRVTDIPEDVAQSEFLEVAKRLASTSIEGGWFSSLTPGDGKPIISFASQFDGFAGTITLRSTKRRHWKATTRSGDSMTSLPVSPCCVLLQSRTWSMTTTVYRCSIWFCRFI
jgi:hypothetical protein